MMFLVPLPLSVGPVGTFSPVVRMFTSVSADAITAAATVWGTIMEMSVFFEVKTPVSVSSVDQTDWLHLFRSGRCRVFSASFINILSVMYTWGSCFLYIRKCIYCLPSNTWQKSVLFFNFKLSSWSVLCIYRFILIFFFLYWVPLLALGLTLGYKLPQMTPSSWVVCNN